MELKLGKMTSRELAQWFGVSYSSYTHNISKYLKQLEWYCEFEKIYGGVIISNIHLTIYRKNYKEEAIKTYLTEYERTGGLMSMTGIEQTTNLSAYEATKVRDELFGNMNTNQIEKEHEKEPDKRKKYQPGVLGDRERIWAIKLGANDYRYFTKEEDELFDALIDQMYCGKLTPKIVREQQLILDSCIDSDMSAKEYKEILEKRKYNFFSEVIEKFKVLTGHQIGSPTKHNVVTDFEDDDNEYRDHLIKLLQQIKEETAQALVDEQKPALCAPAAR